MTEGNNKRGREVHKTFCGICSSGMTHCGIDATVQDGLLVSVEGMKEHPANEGTLCVKGASSCQYAYNPRLSLALQGQQSAQIRTQERIRGNTSANLIMQGLQAETGEIRRKMTQKYQVEF